MPPRGTTERAPLRFTTAILVHGWELSFVCLFILVGASLIAHAGTVEASSIQTLPTTWTSGGI